jgi:hypothetical protein
MSNYTKTTNFLAKDSLPENDSGKIIKGSEFDTEFNALQVAVNTKADLASPTLTGVPTAPTASAGTNTTQLATTAFVTSVSSTLGTMSTQNASAVAITGGTITGLSSALPVASGGTGTTTSTGTGDTVRATSPTLVTPALGTPSAVVLTNATGTANSLNAGIGVNQTWQNVTSSRVLGTTYTNSTGKPICATVAVSSNTGGVSSLQKIINGVTIASDNEYGPNSGYTTILDLIIPNGATYSFTASNASLSTWFELR